MARWRVLITDGLNDMGREILEKEADVLDRTGINAEELKEEIKSADAIIVRGRTKITADLIEAGTQLKVIGRCGVGVDNIDLDAASKSKVTVVNAPSATTTAVAELTIGLILSLAREIPRADAGMKDGQWLKKELKGTELYGKTLGIIGFGSIGSTVGQMAAALGMHIAANCDFRIPETIRIIGGELLSFEDVLEMADFISIHTPLTKKTRGMFNSETIAKMKDGVYIVCTARGGIIEEKTLLDALNSGKVAGAALDVYATEPPDNMDLIRHPKLIATPHIAGQTRAAQQRAAIDISTEVLAALKNEKLRWQIV
jgi:D-3-phosphoglycerate dehydrogenase